MRILWLIHHLQKNAYAKWNAKLQLTKTAAHLCRSTLRAVEDAITAGDQKTASDALTKAEPAMMRAVGKGIFHKNTGARKISRLAKRVKALG